METELEMLGERPRVEAGGVAWTGDFKSIMRANLWLRTASRVIVRVATFRAEAFHELERQARRVDWSQFVGPGTRAEFRVTTRKSRLYHSDAIAERLDRAVGASGEDGARQLFVVRVFRDEFTISADTSGALLHMRGYRQALAKAPIRETLAATMLLGAFWSSGSPLVDPMCGSGTIPIEAAMASRGMAPGRNRRFAWMQWPSAPMQVWERMLADARLREVGPGPIPILASDRDAGAIEAVIANAERAGVADSITTSVRAISSIDLEGLNPGLVAINPPYGERVGKGGDVRNLFAQLGKVLKARARGWKVALYTPDRALAMQTALPLEPILRTSNGGIPVTLMIGTVPD